MERVQWGTTASGERAQLFTLRNRRGLTARVGSLGATLVSLRVPDAAGTMDNVVLGFETLAEYEADGAYFGRTVGRYAGRIRDGRLPVDGKVFQLSINESPNHLHGGTRGFSHRVWHGVPVEDPGVPSLTLSLRSPDGDEGYPGTVDSEVTYSLEEEDTLRIAYRAWSDAATHINLTNHSYFNLCGRGDILEHRLELRAGRYTPADEAGIPTGILASVVGTPMDFTYGKPLGQDIEAEFDQLQRAGGYDLNFAIDGWDGTLRECASLTDPESGRTMTVATTCPGVQLYTANFLGASPALGGGRYGPRQGVCLETQYFPDTPNQPRFPSTRLAPGREWRQTTVLRFDADG